MLMFMMLYGSLNNYIATHRRLSGLSQDELAVLLGLENGAAVGRYENAVRLPELRALLAFEIVLDEPLQALFAGEAEYVRREVRARAKALLEGATDKPSEKNAQKLQTLDRLAHLEDEYTIRWEDLE